LSDIHLHHPRTPTTHIIDNLVTQVFHNKEAASADIMWVSGDLFDRLVTVPDEDNLVIIWFINRLLQFCSQHDIALRVLEGTGSHDYGQPKVIAEYLKGSKFNVDYRYFSALTIDYDERFDLNVLYIPDELNADASVTWTEVRALMESKGLSSVDYAIMHGMFEFQLPEHVNSTSAHLSTRYESIVKRHVLIGHHHTHRVEGKIIVPGSFDRLAHGEEQAKGYILIRDYGTHSKVKFVENTKAKIYRTINLHGRSLEESIELLDGITASLPRLSAVAIKANAIDGIATAMDVVKSRYPELIWTSSFEREDHKAQRLEEIETTYNPIRITKENISELLIPRVVGKVSSEKSRLAVELLEALL